MGWNCKECGTHNEDEDVECIVCGKARSVAEYKETVSVPKASSTSYSSTPSRTSDTHASSTTYTSDTYTSDWLTPPIHIGLNKKDRIIKIIAFCLIWLSFIVGQILLYVFLYTKNTVFVLTDLVENLANVDFNKTAFIIIFIAVTTVIGVIAGVFICWDLAYFIEYSKYAYIWLITIPYCITMILIPSLISCLALIFGVLFVFIKKYRIRKLFIIIYVALMALSLIVFPVVATQMSKVDAEAIQSDIAIFIDE